MMRQHGASLSSTTAQKQSRVRPVVPGLALAVAIAGVGLAIDAGLSSVGVAALNAVFLAVVGGIALRAVLGERSGLASGTGFAAKRVLRAGVLLLGLRFGLGQVTDVGLGAILAIVAVIATAFAIVWVLMRFVPITRRLGVLIAVGTAICGNSAIAATAPLIGAREEEVSFATGIITLFGTLAMLLYPAFGLALGLDDDAFGLFAGVGVHDSGQAIAAGFIFSAAAGGVATVVKLTRTVFLVPLLLAVSTFSYRRERAAAGASPRMLKVIPWFALGFVGMSAVRTVGDSWFETADWWTLVLQTGAWLATFLIVVAMAGIGLATDLRKLRGLGAKAFTVGLVAAATVSAVALVFALQGG